MNEWAGVFLAVIALAAVVQCVSVVLAVRSLRVTGERLNDLCRRFESEIKPSLEDLRKGASNLRAISDSGREQAARIEALLSTTLSSIEATVESARVLVMRPLASLADLSAFWSGLKQGIDSYRNDPVAKRPVAAPPRRADDADEHMFIG